MLRYVTAHEVDGNLQNLTKNTWYTVGITAYNEFGGSSQQRATVEARTLACPGPPPPPTLVVSLSLAS